MQQDINLPFTIWLTFTYGFVPASCVQQLCLEEKAYPSIRRIEPPFPIGTRPSLFGSREFVNNKRRKFLS